jgi:6-phosphofructokinase 1
MFHKEITGFLVISGHKSKSKPLFLRSRGNNQEGTGTVIDNKHCKTRSISTMRMRMLNNSPLTSFVSLLSLLLSTPASSLSTPRTMGNPKIACRMPSSVLILHSRNDECSLDLENGDDRLDDCLRTEGFQEETSEFLTITKIYKANLESLRSRFESSNTPNRRMEYHRPQPPPLYGVNSTTDGVSSIPEKANGKANGKTESFVTKSHVIQMEYNELLTDDDIVLVDTVRSPKMHSVSRAFVRAGPREMLHFEPSTVNAAIVTCGGLCPGLNTVLRELTHALYYLYGARTVWGVRGGFHGFHDDLPGFKPILLTQEMVENIHHEGGTLLRSSRGGFDVDKIIGFLEEKDIQHLYVIGGDGTHRGAYRIHQECVKRNLNVAVAGIPKTIDNDIDYIDRSFGFLTAVEAAQASIHTAKTEAMCTMPNGITVVKLMGRSAGFLAAFSALGSGDVDCLLVPEVPIVLDGPDGILPFLRKRVHEQKYAVVVVAEGAGEELLGTSTQVDRGGNRKLPPIGEYMRDQITEYFLKHGEDSTVRYIDPSYTVRSVPANACDNVYCTQLAQCAVHGAMAGYTGFSAGLVNNQMAYIPIPQLVASSPRNMDPYGAIWEKVLAMTGQPNHAPPRVIFVPSAERIFPKPEHVIP